MIFLKVMVNSQMMADDVHYHGPTALSALPIGLVISSAVCSRQKPRLKTEQLQPRRRLHILISCLGSWLLPRPRLCLLSSASPQIETSEPLSYVTIS